MKMFRTLGKVVLSTFALGMITACIDDKDNFYDTTINFSSMPNISFNEEGYWDNVYSPDITNFTVNNFTFSHQASADEWDGIIYYAWTGFCPTKSTDNTDYGNGDWTSHQWGSITGGGVSGQNDPYILGYCNEDINPIPNTPACFISYNGKTFNPKKVYITNNAWGYYSMKNGSAFNKKFEEGDWCTLHIYGMKNGKITGIVDVLLANGNNILNSWKQVNLEPLGENLDMIYFQMTSSDSNAWGMKNPAFFCLDNFTIAIN